MTRTNNAGASGWHLERRWRSWCACAIRPPASISRPQRTVNERGERVEVSIGGRHDPCIVPRAVPVLEAMVGLVLADRLLAQRAIGRT